MRICHDHLDDLRYEVLTRTGDYHCPCRGGTRSRPRRDRDSRLPQQAEVFPGNVAERVVRESIGSVASVRPSASGDPDAVGSHMKMAPLTTSADTSVARARQLMARDHVRWVRVVEGSEVVGIVTDRDLAFNDATGDTTIRLLMTSEVIAVSPRTSLSGSCASILRMRSERTTGRRQSRTRRCHHDLRHPQGLCWRS